MMYASLFFFFFSSRRRHTRCSRDWSSDVCSSDLLGPGTQAHGKTREELRALAGMSDEGVRACLKPEISERDAAALLDYYRARRLPSPLFRPSDRKELACLVADCFPESYKETLRRADLACRHVVEVLGSGPTDLGDPINWWTDFKGGTWAQVPPLKSVHQLIEIGRAHV